MLFFEEAPPEEASRIERGIELEGGDCAFGKFTNLL